MTTSTQEAKSAAEARLDRLESEGRIRRVASDSRLYCVKILAIAVLALTALSSIESALASPAPKTNPIPSWNATTCCALTEAGKCCCSDGDVCNMFCCGNTNCKRVMMCNVEGVHTLQQRFSSVDTNGDGKIAFSEAGNWLKTRMTADHKRLFFHFSKADGNHDRYLSLAEFTAVRPNQPNRNTAAKSRRTDQPIWRVGRLS